MDPFFQDILSLTYFKKKIIKSISEDEKKAYMENFLRNQNYQYPKNFIAIPRKWIPNKYMRQFLKNAIVRSFQEII